MYPLHKTYQKLNMWIHVLHWLLLIDILSFVSYSTSVIKEQNALTKRSRGENSTFLVYKHAKNISDEFSLHELIDYEYILL